MIGVAATCAEKEIAREFFELFKTPWERAVPGKRYPAVLISTGSIDEFEADCFLVYGSQDFPVDRGVGVVTAHSGGRRCID